MKSSKIFRVIVIVTIIFFIAGKVPTQAQPKTLRTIGAGLVLGSIAYVAYQHERPNTNQSWADNKIIPPTAAFMTGFTLLLLSKEDKTAEPDKLALGPVISSKHKVYGLSLNVTF